MGDLTDNFCRSEFACRCGCGYENIRTELVEKLQKVRETFGPLTIESGCRCEKYNGTLGGKTDSAHLFGWAADLRCEDSASRFRLLKLFIEKGFRRIGVGDGFIHVDQDPDKPSRLIWIYPRRQDAEKPPAVLNPKIQ